MRTVRRTSGALAVIASCCSLTTAPARALEPGVHVDPGSPAAHEYALPLGQARSGGGGSSSGSEGTTLFGAGIKPPGGGPGGKGTGHGGKGNGSSAGAGAGATSPSATAAPPPPSVLRDAHDHSGDGSLLALIGGGVAILVLGGFGGTVLRHRRPPRPTQ